MQQGTRMSSQAWSKEMNRNRRNLRQSPTSTGQGTLGRTAEFSEGSRHPSLCLHLTGCSGQRFLLTSFYMDLQSHTARYNMGSYAFRINVAWPSYFWDLTDTECLAIFKWAKSETTPQKAPSTQINISSPTSPLITEDWLVPLSLSFLHSHPSLQFCFYHQYFIHTISEVISFIPSCLLWNMTD